MNPALFTDDFPHPVAPKTLKQTVRLNLRKMMLVAHTIRGWCRPGSNLSRSSRFRKDEEDIRGKISNPNFLRDRVPIN